MAPPRLTLTVNTFSLNALPATSVPKIRMGTRMSLRGSRRLTMGDTAVLFDGIQEFEPPKNLAHPNETGAELPSSEVRSSGSTRAVRIHRNLLQIIAFRPEPEPHARARACFENKHFRATR